MTTGSNKEATVSTSIGFSLAPRLVEEGECERRRFVDVVLGFLVPEDLPITFVPRCPLSGVLWALAWRESSSTLTCDPFGMLVSSDSELASASLSLSSLEASVDPADEALSI